MTGRRRGGILGWISMPGKGGLPQPGGGDRAHRPTGGAARAGGLPSRGPAFLEKRGEKHQGSALDPSFFGRSLCHVFSAFGPFYSLFPVVEPAQYPTHLRWESSDLDFWGLYLLFLKPNVPIRPPAPPYKIQISYHPRKTVAGGGNLAPREADRCIPSRFNESPGPGPAGPGLLSPGFLERKPGPARGAHPR